VHVGVVVKMGGDAGDPSGWRVADAFDSRRLCVRRSPRSGSSLTVIASRAGVCPATRARSLKHGSPIAWPETALGSCSVPAWDDGPAQGEGEVNDQREPAPKR